MNIFLLILTDFKLKDCSFPSNSDNDTYLGIYHRCNGGGVRGTGACIHPLCKITALLLWTSGQVGWQVGARGDVDLGRTRLTGEKSGQGGRLSGCPRCSPADELRFTNCVL